MNDRKFSCADLPQQRGIALILVLILLALSTALVIGLLTSVSNERKTAQTTSNAAGSHRLADAAVQIVIGQLGQATTGGPSTTWASQPGMIRTYDSSGAVLTNYKLYSSDALTTAGALTVGASASNNNAEGNNLREFNLNWSSYPGVWTDLNAPVTAVNGVVHFPIVDGNNIKSLTKDAQGNTVTTYFSYDANGDGLPDVKGFGIDPTQVTYNPANALSPSNTPVPMPVKWLYQLRDGTIIAPDLSATATSTVTFANSPVPPSTANPIVGRIAFWTDDESSKININTACGDVWPTIPPATVTTGPPSPNNAAPSVAYNPPGSFWDVPRVFSSFDYNNLAYIQPAQHEYQRYPGHPATVYLSAVFSALTRDQIFSIVPRISGESTSATPGSLGGTNSTPSSTPITVDADRLYASIDELLFKPTTTTVPNRDLNDSSASIINKSTLEQGKFFITANSRAPEVNLFDKPRIAIWPIDSDVVTKEATSAQSPRGTAFDNLIAYCAHTGAANSGNNYFFQRSANGYSSTTQDYNLARNKALYSYLQALMGTNIPGFGSSLATKFGTDANQILTEIFDYVRATNPCDDNIAFKTVDGSGNPTGGANCYTPSDVFATSVLTGGYSSKPILTPLANHAFIAPTQIAANSTAGFGRTVTLSELGIAFFCTADGSSTPTANGYYGYPSKSTYTFTNPLYATQPQAGDGGKESVFPSSATTGTFSYSNFPPLKLPLPTLYSQISSHAFFSHTTGYATLLAPGFQPSNWNRTLPTYDWAADASTGTNWTGLQPGQKRVEAIFLVNPYTVSPGYSTMHMDLGVQVSGLDNISYSGTSIGFPSGTSATVPSTAVMANPTYRTPTFGVNWVFFNSEYYQPAQAATGSPSLGPLGDSSAPTNPGRPYPFISAPFTLPGTLSSPASTFTLTGGANAQIKLWHLAPADEAAATLTSPTSASTLIQTINVDLSQLTQLTWTAPTLPTLPDSSENNLSGINVGAGLYGNVATEWDFSRQGVFSSGSVNGRLQACFGQPGHYIDPIFILEDSVKTLVPGYPTNAAGPGGDYRLLAAQATVPTSVFVPHRLTIDAPTNSMNHSFVDLSQSGWYFRGDNQIANTDFEPTSSGVTTPGAGTSVNSPFGALITSTSPNSAFGNDITKLLPVKTGDFDNGNGSDMDGPYINKPDTGYNYSTAAAPGSIYPYYGHFAEEFTPAFFSPNRQVPSPGMFGSLPVGVVRNLPWQTLLFRPQPTHPDGVPVPDVGGTASSPPYGGVIPDHLLMDLFWMPVVEPYAISEPFSTAGKINMNYQIAPFTYITRATAVDALLKSQRMLAIPNTAVNTNYKQPIWYSGFTGSPAINPSADFRYDLNLNNATGTLRQFEEKFATGDLFRSATQICDIYLTPVGQSWATNANATTFWNSNQFTGDNSRERPYANLYGCLTTKSNTYTVHFRVQTLQKIPGTPANQWMDGQDVVTSDLRGSTLIERYIDASDTTIPDFATAAANVGLDSYYKFRILSTRRFSP